MPWLILELLLGLLVLAVLVIVCLALYRRVRVLLRALGSASERVGNATPDMPNR